MSTTQRMYVFTKQAHARRRVRNTPLSVYMPITHTHHASHSLTPLPFFTHVLSSEIISRYVTEFTKKQQKRYVLHICHRLKGISGSGTFKQIAIPSCIVIKFKWCRLTWKRLKLYPQYGETTSLHAQHGRKFPRYQPDEAFCRGNQEQSVCSKYRNKTE